ncbi:MAG TPA: protein kinase [Sandaracinaceae bacterium LLY-WYZ-13_1]|nr:protein kinase [Sandaracinaceae bacterium LLY-WYZ-13_1]
MPAGVAGPMGNAPPEHPPPAGDADETAPWQAQHAIAEDIPLDSDDFERVTLVDLPTLARYGNYELLGRVAYGGMAEIFLAREIGHQDTRRMMVIKRVLPHVAEDPHFVDMFVDEARLAMQLNHPNVCHVYNFGEAEGTYYIAMEWVNGKPLSKIIKRARDQGGLPIPVALKIIAQVAEALDYAHRACDASGEPLGIVHRDVSPQNIMVSYDGVVKLLDFGIAKATSHSTRTEAGVIKGKFAYMSPQQCVGEPIDSRADVFALGICLFEALAGKNPFRRKTEFETMTKIVGDPTPRLRVRRPEVPEAIEAIADKAMMKQPERRHQTAGEMQLELESELAELGELVNATRLGEYVTTLFAEEVRDGPALDTRLQAPPPGPPRSTSDDRSEEDRRATPPPGSTDLENEVPERFPAPRVPPKRSKGAGPLAMLAVLVLLLGLAGAGGLAAWLVLGDDESDAGTFAWGAEPAEPSSPTSAGPTTGAAPGATAPSESSETSATPGTTRTEASAGSTGPETGEAPAQGTVYVESVPPGASLSFGDREAVGTTPMELGMIEPGTHTVRLTLDGHRDWEGEVTVTEDERVTVTAELEREPRRRPAGERAGPRPPGRLSLNTRPWSKVYLGRRLLGTTPLGRVSVPSGRHRLRLVDRDGAEHRRTVSVPAGGHATESYDLRE